MNKLIVFCLLALSICFNLMATPINNSETVTSSYTDSLYKKYKTHILTLDYNSRKNNKSPFYLNITPTLI
jgi:ABC-type oligopeptide transport system substrate-binding subunit